MADPYVIDMPTVVGNLQLTLANLIALRAEILATPKPAYRCHSHDFDWVGMYKFISAEIDQVMRQISRAQPFECVSIAR